MLALVRTGRKGEENKTKSKRGKKDVLLFFFKAAARDGKRPVFIDQLRQGKWTVPLSFHGFPLFQLLSTTHFSQGTRSNASLLEETNCNWWTSVVQTSTANVLSSSIDSLLINYQRAGRKLQMEQLLNCPLVSKFHVSTHHLLPRVNNNEA